MDRRTFLQAGTGIAATAAWSVAGSGGSGRAAVAARGPAVRSRHRAPTGAAPRSADWSVLARGLGGGLVQPGDADYTSARVLYNTRFDHLRPAAVAYVSAPTTSPSAWPTPAGTPCRSRSATAAIPTPVGPRQRTPDHRCLAALPITVSGDRRRSSARAPNSSTSTGARGEGRHRPRRHLPDRRHLRPDPRRRPRRRLPRVRADLRQPARRRSSRRTAYGPLQRVRPQ